jgi:hypothetical protein
VAELPGLPYVDEHSVDVEAPTERTWRALETYVEGVLASGRSSAFTRLLGSSPRSGFAVAGRVPESRIELVGRHRFSQYRLVFSVLPGVSPGSSRLVATTYAAFPGPYGAAYRLMVISSGLHVAATTRMLRAVASRVDSGAP